jgi:hypothetical protein
MRRRTNRQKSRSQLRSNPKALAFIWSNDHPH